MIGREHRKRSQPRWMAATVSVRAGQAGVFLAPALLVYVAFLLIPGLQMLRMSFDRFSSLRLFVPDWTLANYTGLFTDFFYAGLMARSVLLGVYVTLAAAVLGYPLAVVIARGPARWRGVLMAIVLSPLLINLVVRSYAWLVLLGDRGVLNTWLRGAGLIDHPLALTGNTLGVVIALTHIGLPLMVLSLASVIGGIDARLMEAAESLGASRFRRFRKVFFPLALPGLASGSLLVFCLSVSAFITPQLLGGGRVSTMAGTIYQKFTLSLNWPVGSALVFVLLVLNLVLMGLHARVFRQ